MKRQNNY